MVRTFSKLELIPREFDYKGKPYFLRVWVNAWGELCVGYKEMGSDKVILSYVVQPGRKPYHPDLIEETETSGLNEHIGNDHTLDFCLNAIEDKIMSMQVALSEEEFKVMPNKYDVNYGKDQEEESGEIKVGDEVIVKRTGEKVKIGIITTEGEWVHHATALDRWKDKLTTRWYSTAKSLDELARVGYLLEDEIEKV
jgi:hypothetical protein